MFKGLFSNTRSKGEHFELIAEQFLIKQGLTPVTRNYLCKYGEIDLIMRESQTLVFIEVKYRDSSHFGGAINALSKTKLQRLKRSIYNYLAQHNLHNTQLRVDFVAIQGADPPEINWIRNIF